MRILSWNINGVRTLPQYHPWNTFKSFEGILEELKADVICFQEMKSSRSALPRDVALPGPFNSFFSFPITKGGYSGVAVYTDSRKVTPLKAEEGLSGKLQPKPPLSTEERVSSSYPMVHQLDASPDEDGNTPSSLDLLDSEGRGLVLDFGLFVLINVYCPNETSDARLSFKMNYHLMLQERVRKIVEEEHREVIVVGDINVCATPLDHCDGHLPSNQAAFWEHPARAWLHSWLHPRGPMTDIVREVWPDRKGMYTCWNTRIQARETNYGTRVDYILVTRGLLPWISHGDIQPLIKGSDHCPIYIDLRDEIVTESGEIITLRDAMQHGTTKEPPRIAAKFWDEFAGKQTVLSSFFGKPQAKKAAIKPSSATTRQASNLAHNVLSTDIAVELTNAGSKDVAGASTSTSSTVPQTVPSRPPESAKRKSPEKVASASGSSKRRKSSNGQAKLGSFFKKAPLTKAAFRDVIELEDTDASPDPTPTFASTDEVLSQMEADEKLARELSLSQDASADGEPLSSKGKAAWSSLFAPVKPPNCLVHNEPAKLWTVNKPGPTKGKKFYLCSRPVGPGYDKGKTERLREEVNYEYRCNYFKWAGEVKKEALRGTSGNNSAKDEDTS